MILCAAIGTASPITLANETVQEVPTCDEVLQACDEALDSATKQIVKQDEIIKTQDETIILQDNEIERLNKKNTTTIWTAIGSILLLVLGVAVSK